MYSSERAKYFKNKTYLISKYDVSLSLQLIHVCV